MRNTLVSVENEKFSAGKTLGFCAYKAAAIANQLLISYVVYFATDSLFLTAASIGLVLAASRIFDGFTDLVAGMIIDKTHTKLGTARPWLLAGVAAYIMLILMFSVPDMPNVGKLVWILITYNLNSSVFGTLYNVCEAKLLKHICVKTENRVRLLTYSGIAMSIIPTVISIVLPLMVAQATGNAKAWSVLALIIGGIGIVLTLIAFALCKEYTIEELVEMKIMDKKDSEKVSIKDMIRCVATNKYFGLYLLVYAINAFLLGISTSCGTYYFSRNLNDLTLMSKTALGSLLILPAMLFIPKVVAKIGGIKFVNATLVIGSIGCILRMVVGTNFIGLFIAMVIAAFITAGISYYGTEIVIQCMDYSKLKDGVTVESVYNSVLNFAQKLAMGVSAAALGAVLDSFGYDGALEVQPASALGAINFMYNIFPVICAVIMIICLSLCKVEKANKELRAAQAD